MLRNNATGGRNLNRLTCPACSHREERHLKSSLDTRNFYSYINAKCQVVLFQRRLDELVMSAHWIFAFTHRAQNPSISEMLDRKVNAWLLNIKRKDLPRAVRFRDSHDKKA